MKKLAFILTSFSFLLTPALAYAQSVDILWQGDGYTPPFYEGRAMWSNQSRITLLAVPQGLGNDANLNYKWSRNGTVLGDFSGVGKNTLSFNDSVLSRPQSIKVEIISNNDEVVTQSSVRIAPVVPSVLVFENNPLLGFLFHREVGSTYTLKDAEVTFTSFPFFFNTRNHADPLLTYKWQTNNGEVETKNSVTYRVPDGASGESFVSVNISNSKKILQTAGKSFLVQFGQ